MLAKSLETNSGSDSVSFFRSYTPNYSASLFLNLFKILSFLTFLDVVFAKSGIANPFGFTQGNCSFALTTTPLIDSEGRYRTWPAFESIAAELINGTAGAITQLNKTATAPTIWSESICYVNFLLQSNCSQKAVAGFLDEFKAILSNNTAVDAAKKCLDPTLLIQISLGIVGVIVLIGLIACIGAISKSAYKECQRRGYKEVGDGQQLDSVTPTAV